MVSMMNDNLKKFLIISGLVIGLSATITLLYLLVQIARSGFEIVVEPNLFILYSEIFMAGFGVVILLGTLIDCLRRV